ncbi:MAG: GIY-YIG nuclease family protein [Thermomicrobiales bacterium]
MTNLGKQVRLFLVDGTPGGMRTAEVMNWTGHLVAAPRSSVGELLKRPEAKRTGVYVLLGDNPAPSAYIGEGDDISTRIQQHLKNKDFWDRLVVVTSKDANLTKAHARYLEARLITIAKSAHRVELANNTSPDPVLLPEADVADMEYFVDQLQIVLPVLGVDILRGVDAAKHLAPKASQDAIISPVFVLERKSVGIRATAQQIDGEFTVLTGSTAAREVKKSVKHSPSTTAAYNAYRALHQKLIDSSVLVPTDRLMTFAQDTVFSSPSTAGAIVVGGSCNGRKSWVTETGQTFGDWENQGVDLTSMEGHDS